MSQKSSSSSPSNLKRFITVFFVFLALVAQVFRLPESLFPKQVRKLMQGWTTPMLWLYVKSLGTRIYFDQPCTFQVKSYEPKCEVEEPYRLTPEEIRSFYDNGFTGPLTAISEEEMLGLQEELMAELASESKTYGFASVRDRHLDSPTIAKLFSNPAITESLAQLLGPDILIWRSQFFNKEPGAPPISWHQASTYMLEDYKRPILIPQDTSELFQLTVWIAVDEATVENGCVHFIKGTHDRIRTIGVGGKDAFYKINYNIDFEPDPEDIVPVELRPGQFVIFSERCLHGSPGNQSKDKRRCGINFRAITPTTQVYKDRTSYSTVTLEQEWDLTNWGVYVLRGEDRVGLNKIYRAPN
jgi:non-haem Fe2+, alpha-ketoglutarate-dependent halogenase